MVADLWLLLSASAQFLLVVLGVIVSLQGDWAKRHWMAVLTAFVVLGGIGMYATIQQATESTTASTKLATSIVNLGKATNEISRVQALNTELQKRLLTQSDTIASLSNKGINTTLGGDSFCYMAFEGASLIEGKPIPRVFQVGKYPLYDVTADITDMEKFRGEFARRGVVMGPGKGIPFKAGRAAMVTIPVGNLAVGSQEFLLDHVIYFSNEQSQDFRVSFSARNGFWSQDIKLRRVEGDWRKWLMAFRVTRGNKPKKVLLTHVDEGFPIPVGKIDW